MKWKMMFAFGLAALLVVAFKGYADHREAALNARPAHQVARLFYESCRIDVLSDSRSCFRRTVEDLEQIMDASLRNYIIGLVLADSGDVVSHAWGEK